MLPSRISEPSSTEIPEQEDIFSSALEILFPDDVQNSHGTPGKSVLYQSPRFGEITLRIPAHPDAEEGRKLFAHYLWNAGVTVAAAIEEASNDPEPNRTEVQRLEYNSVELGKVKWERRFWDVRGLYVLELGAGTALPSLISALSNAASVTITDHPSSPALVTDTIATNVTENLFSSSDGNARSLRTSTEVSINGYTWGHDVFHSPTSYGKTSSPQPALKSFNKIIIADCLWMPSQHVNLVKTILTYLAEPSLATTSNYNVEERSNCALVVAGFHTGRGIVSNFFRIATGSRNAPMDGETDSLPDEADDETDDPDDVDDEAILAVKGSLRAASIFEIDVDCNTRPWQALRPGEDRYQAKRWCVCAALVRRQDFQRR